MNRTVTHEMAEDFKYMYNYGYNVTEISKKHNVDRKTVYYWLKATGVDIQKKVKNPSSINKEKFIKLINEGKSVFESAQVCGITYTTSYDILINSVDDVNEHGLKIIEKLSKKIMNKYLKGSGLLGIRNSCNINNNTLKTILERNDIRIEIDEAKVRRYKIVDNYFTIPNAGNMFYLGSIFAVGTIQGDINGANSVTILVASKRLDALYDLLNELYVDEFPKISKTSSSIYMNMFSKDIIIDLIRYGIKSDINIPEEFYVPFMDGYLFSATKAFITCISIRTGKGSYQDFIVNYLVSEIGIDPKNISYTNTTLKLIEINDVAKLIAVHPLIWDAICLDGKDFSWSESNKLAEEM